MTDKQYKVTDLRDHAEPARPSPYNGRGGAPIEQHWWEVAMRAQDTAPASSHRTVCWQHGGGRQVLLTVNGSDPTGPDATQTYPTSTGDRVIQRSRFYQSPGTVLEARALQLPPGPTQEFADSNYIFDDATGVIDIDASWSSEDSANTDSDAVELEEEPGTDTYAGLYDDDGDYWSQVRASYAEYLAPADRETSEIAADYSEDTRCDLVVNHRGGVRAICVNVSERPYIHGTDHDVLESTAHTYPKDLVLPHPEPRVQAADGATYQEQRFGTDRTHAVTERQAERMGPMLWTWSAYDEAKTVTTTNTFVSTTSTTPVGLLDSSVTAWASDEKGWSVPGHYAIPRARLVVSSRVGVIPVRLWVYGSASSGGDGILRIQSSSRSWVDVAILEAATWYTATGYLECQRTSDDDTSYALAVPLVFANTGTVRVHHISCHYGAHAYG